MAHRFTLKTTPQFLQLEDGGPMLVTVQGGTLYYKAAPSVSSSSNDGSVTNGNSVTFTGPNWVVSAGVSAVQCSTPKQAVSGSKGGNSALANLVTALGNLGLVKDSTS